MVDILTSKKIWLFLLMLGAFLVASLITTQIYPAYQNLVSFFFYMTASNSFLGIPHEPLMIYYGKLYPFYIPVLVALIPTVLGCRLDYIVLTPVLKSRYLLRFKRQRFFRKSVVYFKKAPFLTLMVFAVSPVPFWPARIMGIVTRYPFMKYALAVILGRIPRYSLLALGGMALNIPDWVILLIFLVMFSLPFLPKIIGMIRRKFTSGNDLLKEEKDNPLPVRS